MSALHNIDSDALLGALKACVEHPWQRSMVDELYVRFVSNPTPEMEKHVTLELVRMCGEANVQMAIASSMRDPGDDDMCDDMDAETSFGDDEEEEEELDEHGRFDANLRREVGIHEDETGDCAQMSGETCADVAGAESSMTDSDRKSNLEVCRATLHAWNHMASCHQPNVCRFPMAQRVRPYVNHIREMKEQGIVGLCLESCRFCAFYDSLKRNVQPSRTLNPREEREQKKRNRLERQFAGLLLAHKHKGVGDPEMRELYEHTMTCEIAGCQFRVAAGSCRSSRQLLFHLQECKARHTKFCELCSNLPPKVRNMKKAPRSLPVPVSVRDEILEARRMRQRQRRRERNARKRMNGGYDNASECSTPHTPHTPHSPHTPLSLGTPQAAFGQMHHGLGFHQGHSPAAASPMHEAPSPLSMTNAGLHMGHGMHNAAQLHNQLKRSAPDQGAMMVKRQRGFDRVA